MCEPPSHEPHSQQSQPEPSVQQKNAGSMGGGQQAAIGDRNVQVQGKGNWVWNFFFGWGGKSLTPRQEDRNRQALLNKVNKFWVKDVLEKSLYNQVMIELGLEERPDAITNPWSAIIETNDSPQPLPDGTKIIDIFDQIGIGRTLLILGEPGSGKTTTLLELTRDLIARAEQDINRLIPVVFNLSSWANKRETIADWLVEELNTKYDVPKKIGQDWVTQQQLLPLLDGLDEVKAEYRDHCIAALNQFKQEYGAELVVCSRIKDYEALSNRLNFQSAVYIKLLTVEQIYNYLDSVGADLVGLRVLMAKDTVLQELAQSPLMLNIMTLAYQGVAVEDLPKTEMAEERRKQLFDDYIEKMFHRPNRSKGEQRYSKFQTKHWLSWLAQRMLQESQTVFFIEGMQPHWLIQIELIRIYQIWTGLIIRSMVALPIGIFVWLFDGLINGLIPGMVGWFSVRLNKNIEFTEILTFIWSKRKTIWWLSKFGLILWLLPVILTLIVALILGEINKLLYTAIFLLLLILIIGLISGFYIIDIKTNISDKPNQKVWISAKNATIIGLMGGLLFGGFIGLGSGLINDLNFGKIVGIGTVLTGILILGMEYGGQACIQHFTLRLILWSNNYIPWNYAHFLDYAAERLFLQKVGGGYIFIHRMLMEHFAQMERER